jgi:hypothetical protein
MAFAPETIGEKMKNWVVANPEDGDWLLELIVAC